MQAKRNLVFLVLFLTLTVAKVYGGDIRRAHKFLRPLAMGDAFTAVADSLETVSYNPAGILQQDVEWSLGFPFIGIAFNDIVKRAINGSLDIDFADQSSLQELPGTRIYVELQPVVPFLPVLFLPNLGIYSGLSTNAWVEFVFPPQTIIPMVHLEAIGQAIFEYGMAFEILDMGLYVGANLKAIKRTGVIADISLLRLANLSLEELEDEYNPNPPPPKLVADVGLLYRFDHPWNPRLGIYSQDMASIDIGDDINIKSGGVDYGSAGEVKQFNAIGVAATQVIGVFDLTYSLDFHDFTFSYFPNNSLQRRIAIGFEAGIGREPDNSHLVAFRFGVRELKYPSFGYSIRFGVLDIGAAQWTENFGTEKNPVPDTRYMFAISFVF